MPNSTRMVTILGPTACGKSKMALQLALLFNGEIICADSRTVYKGMDIGTAKPSKEDQKLVRHHLLNITTPDKPISVARYKKLAQLAITDISSRGKLPLLVGGSGLYIDAILYDYTFRDVVSLKTKDSLSSKTLLQLQTMALEKYPHESSKINLKNRRRVEQLITKGPAKDNDRANNKIDSLVLGIGIKKAILKQNITTRTKNMLSNNFIHEVQRLEKKYGQIDILIGTTGYAQVLKFLHRNLEQESLELAIVDATWQLTRKQMTWFRRNPAITWISNIEAARESISSYLETAM